MERYRKTGFPGGPTMHDPLALASMIDPRVVTLQDYFVDIETSGEITAGESVGYRRRTDPPFCAARSRSSCPRVRTHGRDISNRTRKLPSMSMPSDFLRLLITRLTA